MTNTKKDNTCPETSRSEEFSSNSCYYRFNERGFSNTCMCGSDVTVFTSQSKTNPGRPYFRCATRVDGHLFKWVEEGMYEEVVDMLQRESEIVSEKIKVDELKAMVLHLEKEIGWCKSELRKAKIKDMAIVGCILGLVVYSIW